MLLTLRTRPTPVLSSTKSRVVVMMATLNEQLACPPSSGLKVEYIHPMPASMAR